MELSGLSQHIVARESTKLERIFVVLTRSAAYMQFLLLSPIHAKIPNNIATIS
jgi:hypothetical protein